jgi:hypothetical protein
MSEDDAGSNAGSDAVDMRGRESPFGGLTPSEAAQRRWSGARRQESPADLDPLAKQRAALEKKANTGDVYAVRELRENADYWYAQAGRDDALKLMSAHQLAIVRACVEDALEGRESDWIAAGDVPQHPLH